MIYQSLETGGHNWKKKNLVGQKDRNGLYDLYQCSCGAKGKSRSLGTIEIDGRVGIRKAQNCPNAVQQKGMIEITKCTAHGPQFENLTPGSHHNLIDPPEGYPPNQFWVMGVGEPVRIMSDEFITI